MKFEELSLHNDTLKTLKNTDHQEASSLQESIINATKSKKDLVIKAEKGDDKAVAIAITALEKVNASENEKGIGVLILSDDAESLAKIEEQLFALKSDVDCIAATKNGEIKQQSDQIESGASIVLADPARLHAIMKQNRYIFRHLELLVLDRMDEMIANGQADSLKSIKRRLLSEYTVLVCAVEMEDAAKKAALDFTSKPTFAGFENGPDTPPSVSNHLKQGYIKVPPRMKITTLMALLENFDTGNCIIFTASKRSTDRLYRILKKQRKKAVSLHYKLSKERRARRFASFTNGNVQFLLVSDISAAELDVNGVTQVINYDVPNNPDEYRFRAAMVGTGKNNRITSLVSRQDQSDINDLQNELGQTPDEIPLPDKVEQKLKERKNKKRSNGRNGRGRDKKHTNDENKTSEPELPRPTYDQLSGGRSGEYSEEETGIVNFFKKLFS